MKEWPKMQDWMKRSINKPWERIKKVSAVQEQALQPKKQKRKKKRERKERLRRERAEAAHRCHAYLKDFWPRFNAAQSDLNRLELLRRAAFIPGWSRVSKDLRKILRGEFRKSAYKLLDVPIEKCATCEQRPQEKHHIIPLYYGGINDNLNLLLICTSCHDFIHPWMKTD